MAPIARARTAGRLQSLVAVVLLQTQDPQGRAEALLGQRPGVDDRGDQRGAGWADSERPACEALRGPLQPALVAGGHVLLEGGVPAALVAADVAGDAGVLVEALHRGRGVAQVDLFADQPVGNAVVVALELDVIVDVHGGPLPLGELVGLCGQRLEFGPVDLLEGLTPAAGQLLEGPEVELFQQLGDAPVELSQAEEALVADARQDPAFDYQDPAFHLGLVAGLLDAGGQDGGAVVIGHLQIAGVEVGLVEAGLGDAGAGVVGHHRARGLRRRRPARGSGRRSSPRVAGSGSPRHSCSWRPPARPRRSRPAARSRREDRRWAPSCPPSRHKASPRPGAPGA